jgi:ABC-type multidrug transport system ATPase subunit
MRGAEMKAELRLMRSNGGVATGEYALRGVELTFPARAVVAVVGQNGSGKTTLARCLSGHLKPSRGLVPDPRPWRRAV